MAEYRLPKERGIDVSGSPFSQSSYGAPAFKRPIVGRFGEVAGGDDPATRYRLAQYDPAVLGAMGDDQLRRLLAKADTGYDSLEANWQTDTPEGYTGIYATEDGPLEGPSAANPERDAALAAISEAQGAVQAELARRRQMELYQRNQLFGGIAEQGYSFAPGSLADTSVQDEIWQNRERLPFFLKQQAASRNYLRGPNDQNPDGFQWRPRRPIDWNGAEYDPSMEPGPEVESRQWGRRKYTGQSIDDFRDPQPVFQLPQEPDYRPMRPVFDSPSRVGPAPTRSVTGRQTLRAGVSVRNPLSAPRRQSPFG